LQRVTGFNIARVIVDDLLDRRLMQPPLQVSARQPARLDDALAPLRASRDT